MSWAEPNLVNAPFIRLNLRTFVNVRKSSEKGFSEATVTMTKCYLLVLANNANNNDAALTEPVNLSFIHWTRANNHLLVL